MTLQDRDHASLSKQCEETAARLAASLQRFAAARAPDLETAEPVRSHPGSGTHSETGSHDGSRRNSAEPASAEASQVKDGAPEVKIRSQPTYAPTSEGGSSRSSAATAVAVEYNPTCDPTQLLLLAQTKLDASSDDSSQSSAEVPPAPPPTRHAMTTLALRRAISGTPDSSITADDPRHRGAETCGPFKEGSMSRLSSTGNSTLTTEQIQLHNFNLKHSLSQAPGSGSSTKGSPPSSAGLSDCSDLSGSLDGDKREGVHRWSKALDSFRASRQAVTSFSPPDSASSTQSVRSTLSDNWGQIVRNRQHDELAQGQGRPPASAPIFSESRHGRDGPGHN